MEWDWYAESLGAEVRSYIDLAAKARMDGERAEAVRLFNEAHFAMGLLRNHLNDMKMWEATK